MGSLKCENIKKVYGKKEVLKDVNLRSDRKKRRRKDHALIDLVFAESGRQRKGDAGWRRCMGK